jgi:thiol-disulfide isomerase/thioredoxin
MLTKICSKCNVEKEVCEFNKRNNSKDTLQSWCVSCDKIYKKEYYEKNVGKIKENRKNRYINNIDKVKEYNENNKEKIIVERQKYYENNKEYFIKKSTEYYNNNTEKIKEQRKDYYINNVESIIKKKKEFYKNNSEKIKEKRKEYCKNNVEVIRNYYNKKRNFDLIFKLSSNIRSRIRVYLKSKNIKKHNKTFDIVGCTPDFLKEYLEKQFTEGMSWELMGRHIHIDHIIPLSSAKTEEEIYKLCHYTNLQPLWAEDNLKKSDKILL